MPPFRLELPDKNVFDKRTQTTLYTRKAFSPSVKVSGWETHSESLPVDIDPYSPKAFNLHFSHYNHLGVEPKVNYKSTTKAMMEQLYERRPELEINPKKDLINLYSDIDAPTVVEGERFCSSRFSLDYRTTIQRHFQPPYPVQPREESVPEIPYFLHRHMKNTGSCKFFDDDFIPQTKRLQKHKSHKFVSYNPGTGRYTDGSV